MIKHVVTRWLTLSRAVERVIKCWPAIKQYFLKKGEDDTHNCVWMFIKSQTDEMNDDLSDSLTVPECYLYFVHHFMHILTNSLLLLQSETIMSSDIHRII